MKKDSINEAFVVSKTKDRNNNFIAYIDPTKPENKETFKYKDVFSKHGAKWDKINKFWFWYIGKTEEQWKNVYNKFIHPALLQVHKLEGATEEQSKESLIASLDALISVVHDIPVVKTGEEGITAIDKGTIEKKLIGFKEQLVNLENDEQYKETMRIILAFKNAQGHPYSFINTILIWLQNPNATFVMSRPRWNNYNRTIKKDAKAIIVRSPSKAGMRNWSDAEKDAIINKFLSSVGKKSLDDLSIGEKDRLNVMLRGTLTRKSFDFTEAFDVKDTIQMEGKEDYAKDIEKKGDIKWYEGDMVDEKVRPLYSALETYAKDLGINVNYVSLASMGGARGSSGSGTITMPENEGNDVGLTKTFAHELSHELLHQKYVSEKNKDLSKYFLGTEQGRALVEQQAELSAWLIMGLYGFDLKTTSINYAALWGADKNDMVKVYDMVTSVVNHIVDEVNKRLSTQQSSNNQPITEEESMQLSPAKHITPLDVAKAVGNEGEYQQIMKSVGQMNEMLVKYKKLINY